MSPWWTAADVERRYPAGPSRSGVLRGSEHAGAKLTERIVWEMRQAHLVGWSYRKLADRYGVSWQTVNHAVTGRSWRHVGTEEPAP